jgi:hypothetical protein
MSFQKARVHPSLVGIGDLIEIKDDKIIMYAEVLEVEFKDDLFHFYCSESLIKVVHYQSRVRALLNIKRSI